MSLLPREAAGGGADGGCRRRLFADEEGGDGDQPGATDNVANVLLEELRAARLAASRRWNFDFDKERALEGSWQWEAVEQPGPVEPPPAADRPSQPGTPPPSR